MSIFSEVFDSGRRGRRVARTRRQAAGMLRQGRNGTISGIASGPLLYAVIGVAVGAAIASLLSTTGTKNFALRDAGERVKRAASKIGANALDSAKAQAAKVAEGARTAAKPFTGAAEEEWTAGGS